MSTLFYYIWTIETNRKRPVIISTHADSFDEAYLKIKTEVEKLSASVRNPNRYLEDPETVTKLKLLSAITGNHEDFFSDKYKSPSLPASLMQLLDNTEPKINCINNQGIRLDRMSPVIC
jgi:hypothetical protein